MRRCGFRIALVTSLAALAAPGRAAILDQFIDPLIPGVAVEPGVTVVSRLRPDYDYRAVRAGDFIIRPEVSESLGYLSNVLGTSNAKGSAVVDTGAGMQVLSDWSRNAIGAAASFDDTRYLQQPNFSALNWNASLGGTFQINRDSAFAGYAHQTQNQTPRDLDTPRLDRPIAYRADVFRLGYDMGFNRLSLRPEINVQLLSFDNGTVGGQPYIQRFRNRTVLTTSVVASYRVAERRRVVLVVRNAAARYNHVDTTGLKRDYNDSSVLAGVDDDVDGIVRIRALVGYETRTFSATGLKTIQAPIAEASVIFNPNGLTTLTALVARRIADSGDESTTGYTETTARLVVDHEYLRNVLLQGQVAFTRDEYPGGGGTQSLIGAGGSITWLINRNLRLSLSDAVTMRNSRAVVASSPTFANPALGSQPFGGSYSDNVVFLKFSIGL